ncbi:MAG: iron-sulfur cluster assembly protein [Rickettsiales bacterium]|jgi:metal-sulfur cluster biosynthetic enzyme|nr:iron-sulfur cluster assembly protein [Rickettsiales bacterium]
MMKDKVIAALKNVYDPEIPVNIWDLGLVYDIGVTEDKTAAPDIAYRVSLEMTMTSPTCPMSDEIMEMARAEIAKIPGVGEIKIDLVWQPQWELSRMSEAAKLELDLTEAGW